jgi:hypothetical protein
MAEAERVEEEQQRRRQHEEEKLRAAHSQIAEEWQSIRRERQSIAQSVAEGVAKEK